MYSLDGFSYFFKANLNTYLKKYNKALEYYIRYISYNLNPTFRFIDYDKRIEKVIDKIIKNDSIKLDKIDIDLYESKKIMILSTEIYDTGGHTECAINFINSFCNDYEIYFYLTDIYRRCKNSAPIKSAKIKTLVKDFYKADLKKNYVEKIFELYNYIKENKISTVNVNIHMQDVVGSALLYLLSKYSNINIVFWNHADHYYSLGTKYADKILTRCKNNRPLTPYLKNRKNALFLPFLMKCEDNIGTDDNIVEKIHQKFSIPMNAFVTLTGCNIDKLSGEYFKLIKKILDFNQNIFHIWVCTLSEQKKEEIYRKFKLDRKRFIINDFVSNFDDFIKSSNAYIDSFPQGSALTLVDCMRLGVPSITKVNLKQPIKSFEEYFYQDYELSSVSVDEMFNNVIKLSSDKNFYNKIKEKISKHFKNTYSFEEVKPLYEDLIK